jgi:hypothetical protein
MIFVSVSFFCFVAVCSVEIALARAYYDVAGAHPTCRDAVYRAVAEFDGGRLCSYVGSTGNERARAWQHCVAAGGDGFVGFSGVEVLRGAQSVKFEILSPTGGRVVELLMYIKEGEGGHGAFACTPATKRASSALCARLCSFLKEVGEERFRAAMQDAQNGRPDALPNLPSACRRRLFGFLFDIPWAQVGFGPARCTFSSTFFDVWRVSFEASLRCLQCPPPPDAVVDDPAPPRPLASPAKLRKRWRGQGTNAGGRICKVKGCNKPLRGHPRQWGVGGDPRKWQYAH